MFIDLVRELKATEQQLVGQLEGVRAAISALETGGAAATPETSDTPVARKRSRISAKGRAAISRAQKLRWAKQRAEQ